jgi:hypothetical protein
MKRHLKPVRKCHGCLLNLGDHCWIYQYPRGQWRAWHHCRGREDVNLHESYRDWLKMPTVKSRKELRQNFFRAKRRVELHRELVRKKR